MADDAPQADPAAAGWGWWVHNVLYHPIVYVGVMLVLLFQMVFHQAWLLLPVVVWSALNRKAWRDGEKAKRAAAGGHVGNG